MGITPNNPAQVEAWREQWRDVQTHMATTNDLLGQVVARLDTLLQYQSRRDRRLEPLALSQAPTRLRTSGYRRMRLWFVAAQTVAVNLGALGAASINFPAGWTAVDYPDDTELSVAAGTVVNVVLELSDVTV